MKNKLLLCLYLFFSIYTYSQEKKVEWGDMTDVNFKNTFLENFGDYFLVPTFGDDVRNLEGEEIEIKGYVLDLIEDGKTFLLSKQPMASCFFCGMAGPETIIELQFNEKRNLETDQIITVKGILHLNKNDINHCNYILKNVQIIDK